jgi:predicted  nucleic acid-binding Zn-ribbon protein
LGISGGNCVTTFDLDEHKMPLAVRRAYRRLEAENQRLMAEVEWCRAQIRSQEDSITTLKRAVSEAHDMIPAAFREAREKAARLADEPTAEKIRAIVSPYQ